ncbi:MAG: hypothetical protein ACMUIU_00380 [bacterium]
MKSRNWKLCILVIFLAVCFSIYAGVCYCQTYGTVTLPNMTGLGQWNTGYTLFSEQNYYPIQPYSYSSMYQGYPFGYSRTPIWGWREPPGKSTLKLLQDLMPGHSLTYMDVYGIEDEPVYGIVGYRQTRTYPYPYPYGLYGLGSLGSTINTWSNPYGYYGGYNYSYGYGL